MGTGLPTARLWLRTSMTPAVQGERAGVNDGAKAGSQANGGVPFDAYSTKLAVPGAGGPRQQRIAPLDSASIKMTEIGRSPPSILSLMDACRA